MGHGLSVSGGFACRLSVVALSLAASLAACSSPGVESAISSTTTVPLVEPESPTGLITLDPHATPPHVVWPPLPDPELTDGYEIGYAIFSPMTRAQGVVSMLHALGIGIYTRDGTPMRVGDERASTDLWLYEEEVHALIEMAAAESTDDFVRFVDWHAALQGLGLEMTAQELAEAYEQAYVWDTNGSVLVEILLGMGLDLYENSRQVSLTRLQAWLLLLDGFVVPTGGAVAIAHNVAAFRSPVAVSSQEQEKWGGASTNIHRPLTSSDLPLDWFSLVARLETLARSVPLTITPSHQRTHEGHGADGDPVDFEVWFLPYDVPATTPFGDHWFLLPMPDPDGLVVNWHESTFNVLGGHGRMHDHDGRDLLMFEPSTTRHGRAVARYVPRREEADGEGRDVYDQAQITASVSLYEVAKRTWQIPEVLLGYLVHLGDRSVSATLEIEWHEIRGLRIDMTDEYDVGFELPTIRGAEMSLGEVRRVGTDRFTGFLALQDDGTYRGLIRGETSSEYYERAFGEECSTALTGSQELLVIAETVPEGHAGDPGHPIVVRFYPMGQPEIAEIGCDFTLDAFPDDPERGIRWGVYAPFNDLRVTDPVRGFLTAMPEGGEWTYVYREFAPGLGGGTWTVTIEVVEPEG